ncbi:hypothetical protein [Deinococcus sedimenti]|uniref:Lipoprotein n=1 Tax=Deinococcus sedimenti TaxID=1867090 RepID=A0ABQ2S327_9DEIO|nr:hypothetical protein [Deinococcus sedimenti]GGR91313.1 hypothetical protein GCM10008960_17970 [Deinococcus sedimenti]
MKRLARLPVFAVLSAAVLSGCGVLPTPSVDLKDTRLDLPSSSALSGKVVYLQRDSLAGNTVPGALQQISVRGTATYRTGGLGSLSEVQLFVRPDLTALPSTSTVYAASPTAPGMVVCDAAGEAGQAIGTLTLKPAQGVPFTLSGPALDTAAKSGHGFFGMRFSVGASVFGDTVDLTGMKASARL